MSETMLYSYVGFLKKIYMPLKTGLIHAHSDDHVKKSLIISNIASSTLGICKYKWYNLLLIIII